MKINAFSFNPFGEMTYVLWDDKSLEAAIVDPGMATDSECRQLDDFVSRHNLKVKYLVNTHLHLDHAFGNGFVEQKYGVKTSANKNDEFLGKTMKAQIQKFHLPMSADEVNVDNFLSEGDILTLGTEKLYVVETPGHSPGSICLYCPDGGFLIAGDTLFKGSVGRTDLPGGSHQKLIESIRGKLFSLPPETLVCPGHGPTTTIADEMRTNPYV